MTNRTEVVTEITSILNKVKDNEIKDLDENLFGRYYDFTSGEMLDVCMELKKRYNINLNSLIQNIKDYTVNNIADALCKVIVVNV